MLGREHVAGPTEGPDYVPVQMCFLPDKMPRMSGEICEAGGMPSPRFVALNQRTQPKNAW